MIKIGGVEAQKGERVTGFLEAGKMANGCTLKIPVIIVNGKEEGPTLWLNGAVHGDELNGIIAIRRIAFDTEPDKLKGSLICTPVCNLVAFQAKHKLSNFDYLDLDQQFPGNPNGCHSERIAYLLFEQIKNNASYLINFHTLGRHSLARPYTVFKLVSEANKKVLEEVENVAKVFGVYLNCKVDITAPSSELPGSRMGALDVNCIKNGVPAFMAEMGSGGRFEQENIEIAYQGIKNVMNYLKMIPGESQGIKEQIIMSKRDFIRCNEAGFAFMKAKPYDFVKKGSTLACLTDFFGNTVEEIIAPRDCYVIAVLFDPVVNTGDLIALIGFLDKN